MKSLHIAVVLLDTGCLVPVDNVVGSLVADASVADASVADASVAGGPGGGQGGGVGGRAGGAGGGFAGGAGGAGGGGTLFAGAVNYGTGTNPFSVMQGDWNGDGRADLA